MGLFDYVNYECVCPRCNGKVDGFQTKDGPGNCSTEQLMEPKDIWNFYSTCDSCGAWIELDVSKIIKRKTKITMRPICNTKTRMKNSKKLKNI